MRFPFGIKSVLGYFQEIMEQLIRDLLGVIVCMDNILVSSSNAQEHLENLRALLRRINEKGVTWISASLLKQVLNTWDAPCQKMELPGIQGGCCNSGCHHQQIWEH